MKKERPVCIYCRVGRDPRREQLNEETVHTLTNLPIIGQIDNREMISIKNKYLSKVGGKYEY